MNTTPPMPEHLPWWRERMVWLIIALPLSAVVAGIATVFIAAHDPDDLVKTEYTKTGLAVDASQAASRTAAQMGLAATLRYSGDALEMSLANATQPEAQLTLSLVHPTQAELDQQIPLLHVGQGKYQARITLSGQGKRLVILEPPAKNWQLRGEWRAPFNEEMSLRADGALNPPNVP